MADERLRLIAEATGFEDSQKAVDALAEAQRRLKETNEKIEQVRATGTIEELGQLTVQQDKLQKSVALLSGNTTEANIGLNEMANVAQLIDPRLGELTGQVGGLLEAFGDLGTKQLSIGELFKSGTALATKYAGALKLLGAAGFAALGIGAVVSAVRKMREELEEANKAIERQRDLLTGLRSEQSDQRTNIQQIADLRPEGRFTPDDSRKAQALAESIRRRIPELDEGAVNRAVANLFGTGVERQVVERSAFLIQAGQLDFPEGARSDRRAQAANAAILRNQPRVSRFEESQAVRERELIEAARQEATSDPGSTTAMRRLIRERIGRLPDQDLDDLLDLIRRFPNSAALEQHFEGTRRLPTSDSPDPTPVQMALLEQFHTATREITIINNEYNSRKYGPDGASYKGRVRNGETRAKAFETFHTPMQ